MLPDFEEDFAGLAEYARMYRALGLQAVPSYYPSRQLHNWKRPALKEWRDFQNELVDDETFDKWFANVDDKRNNIGILTGNCSGRVFAVDLDTHSKPDAALWWSCCLDMQDHADELYTPTQRTGGGGLQILFRAPEGWNPPTIKTSLGVDIRGVGGFIVAAPSMHESGRRYQWVEGQEPWEIPIVEAPAFLCEQIDILAEKFGGHAPSHDPHVKTDTPDHAHDQWGELIDGREDYMFRMIWARLVDMARDCPIMPGQAELDAERNDLFTIYLSKVGTRIPHGPAADKAALLEKEGRGPTEFASKWKAALKEWDKILEAAKKPKPRSEERATPFSFAERIEEGLKGGVVLETVAESTDDWDTPKERVFNVVDPAPSNLFEVLSVEDIMNLPDPVFLIQDLMIESALAFIYGVPGCGKTFVALDMAFALGVDEITHWFGHKINKHGPVLYISSEGVTDMKFRMQAWEHENKLQINRKRFHFIRQSVNFMDPAHIVKLIQTIKAEIEGKINEKPVLIVVDTVSRVLPGADENLQKDMTLYIQACDAIRLAFDCAVLGVHHMSKSGGTQMRGSSVFEGSANMTLHVEREKPAMIGTMTARKVKEARDGWETPFELKDVDLGFGRGSLVACKSSGATSIADSAKDAPTGFGGAQETGYTTIGRRLPDAVWKSIFDEVEQAKREGIPWSEFKQAGSRYAGVRILEILWDHGIESMNESDADAIVKRLTGKLYLVSVEYVHNKMQKKGLEVRNRPNLNV